MRRLTYIDEDGLERMVLLRDCDPDDIAIGIPISPPPVSRLDGLNADERRKLHTLLFRRGLFRWSDVIRQQDGIGSVVAAMGRDLKWDRARINEVRRQVVALYRQYEREEKT